MLVNEARTLADNARLTDGDLRQMSGHGSRAADLALEMRESDRADDGDRVAS